MRKRRLASTSLVLTLVLAGCGTSIPYADVPNQQMKTLQEVLDYRAKELSYDSIATRAIYGDSAVELVFNKVKSDNKDKVVAAYEKLISDLQSNNAYTVDEKLHDYLKYYIDDKVLYNGTVQDVKEYCGYYYVTVKYDVKSNSEGTFTDWAKYLGINGTIVEDTNGEDVLNIKYLSRAIKEINENRYNQGLPDIIDKYADEYTQQQGNITYKHSDTAATDNGGTLGETGLGLGSLAQMSETQYRSMVDSTGSTNGYQMDTSGNIVDGGHTVIVDSSVYGKLQEIKGKTLAECGYTVDSSQAIIDAEGNVIVPSEYAGNAVNSDGTFKDFGTVSEVVKETEQNNSTGITMESQCGNARTLDYSASEFNSVVGSSLDSMSYMPKIQSVYIPTSESGDLSGYGIYSQGRNGLKDFGYDRDKVDGDTEVTYVFKGDDADSDKFTYAFSYMGNFDSGIELADDGVTISDFANTELDKIIERADRVINNTDVEGLMEDNIFEDAGLGVLNGMYGRVSNIFNYMTKVDKVLQRNGTEYLVELERSVQDSAYGSNVAVSYVEKYYCVIRQVDSEFKINDIALKSREIVKIPQPSADEASERRLVALGLSGRVSEANKTEINQLLGKLYHNATERSLNGIYSCFDSNTDYVTSEKYEYMNSLLRNRLTRMGTNVKASMTGEVTQWIGGADKQVEFIAEELIQYSGKDKGLYLQSYYLVSSFGNGWVIDECKTIEEKEVSGEELNNLKEKIDSNTSVEYIEETEPETEEVTTASQEESETENSTKEK